MSGINGAETLLADGDKARPYWMGNNYVAQTINSATGTGLLTMVTGAPGYFLTQLGFQCAATTTTAGGATVSIVFSDSVFGTIANFQLWVPASAASPATPFILRETNEGPHIFNNRAANSVLSVNVLTALSGGSIRCFCRYGITNYLG